VARTFGTILIEQLANQPTEVNNDIQSYRIDPDIYKTTGELVKIGEGTIVPTIDQLTAGKIMRDEITTHEEFVTCGTYSEVAKKYKVSPATAHGWMMSLKAKHMGIEPEQKPKSNAQIMREEITTLEQFEAIGNYREVAAKYGVGKTAANDLQVRLRREKEKMEHQSVKAIETEEDKPIEIPCQSVEDGIESVENESEGDCSKEGIEEAVMAIEEMCSSETVGDLTKEEECQHGKPCAKCAEILNDVFCADCGKLIMTGNYTGLCDACNDELANQSMGGIEETKDDLQGLVEPDPTWNYVPGAGFNLSDKALERIAEEIKKPVTDDEIWLCLIGDLNELRERAHKRADHEITNKFLRLMGCGNDSAEGLEGSCELGK